MAPRLLPALLILAAMIGAPTLAAVMRPSVRIADQGPNIDLEAMIPKQFGDWQIASEGNVVIADPKQKQVLDRIYSQTLSRTYVNSAGYLIMLSISYGGDQTDSMQVHKPEVCYPAQGFSLLEITAGSLPTQAGEIPVTRLVTSLGLRREPVTYWTTVGDRAVAGGIQKKLIEMKYGLTGRIPDGLLFRVSSIDPNTETAYEQQRQFVEQLLQPLPPSTSKRLSGLSAP